MTLRLISASFMSILLMLTTSTAFAASKKCPPGAYWDERDQMCIYGNGR